MKLATLPNGTRDGRLVVVNRALTLCADASRIAPTLQTLLDDWDNRADDLAAFARDMEQEAVPVERFHEREALAPLPRAYAWLDGSAYVNHVALLRRARAAEMPESFWTDPLMYQGGSDSFLAPRAPIRLADEEWGVDFEGEVAVIIGDVPMGADETTAHAAIRLVMLANDVSLRNLIAPELSKGFGFVQSKPSTAFSPVAVTPEQLDWREGKLHGALLCALNGKPFGHADAGEDMTFSFPRLIAHAAKTRSLTAGTIIGSGTVSNRDAAGGPGKPVAQGGRGYSCIAEQRTVEVLEGGAATTPFLRFRDEIRIEMKDADNHSVFGAIEQRFERYEGPQ